MSNYLQDEYDRINSPDYAQNEIANRFRLANPALQRQLAGVRANLNQRGLWSSSPVTRSSNQAVSSMSNQISSDVYGGLDQRRFQIMQLFEQRRQEEARRRQQSRAGIGRLIGTGLGAGLGFFAGGPMGAAIGGSIGGGAFGGGGNSYQPLTLAQYMQMTGGLNSTQTNPPE